MKRRYTLCRYIVLMLLSMLIASCSTTSHKISKISAENFEDAISMFNVGCNYFLGKGVPIDYNEAVKWFIKAAQKGHAGAQNNLGICYERGFGVRKDIIEASRLYKMASSQEEHWYNEFNKINEGIRKARTNYERLRPVVVATPKYDSNILAKYPKYRINDVVRSICFIGTGTGSGNAQIEEYLMTIFSQYTNVRIVDTTNLKSVISGKILEFGAGLNPEESQRITRMLQVDHIVYYRENISPHNSYILGGRAYVEIELKIVRSIDGEIIFNTIGNYGATYLDPRPYGYSHRMELDESSKNSFRRLCFEYYIKYPLLFAINAVHDGYSIHTDAPVVENVIIDSPADRAGMKVGDRILSIDGYAIGDVNEYNRYYLGYGKNKKQNETRSLKVRRSETTLALELAYPLLPNMPITQENIDNDVPRGVPNAHKIRKGPI